LIKHHDRQNAELSKIREENAALKAELDAARLSLADSANPSIVELQKAKDDLRCAQLELERVKKARAKEEKEQDYTRTVYRQGLSENHQLKNQLIELQAEVADLRIEASDKRVQIQRINQEGILQQNADMIKELRLELAEKERALEKTSADLIILLNGRRQTRGTSVPRSPRMNTMSPRPAVSSRVLSGIGAGSRGSSPALGEFPSNFRDRVGNFPEGVFGNGPVGSRFGPHLREQ